jgi:hypothetical protein
MLYDQIVRQRFSLSFPLSDGFVHFFRKQTEEKLNCYILF